MVVAFHLPIFGQEVSIDYWKNEKNQYRIRREHYYKDELVKIDTVFILKDELTFKFNQLNIYHTPTTVPTYNNLQTEIAEILYAEKMPSIDYTTILSIIISSEGKILSVGISKGEGYPYDYKVINAVNALKSWKPATYNGTLVNSLIFIGYKHVNQ